MIAVAAVIPNWNGRTLLEPLFGDLRSQTQPPAEIIVVDNGSTDGSADWAEQQGARAIRFAENRGFAAAVNAGVSAAAAPTVAVLNNDVRLQPEWLERTADALERQKASFAVGKLLKQHDPSVIDGTFDALCCGGTAWRCGEGRPDGPVWTQPRPIQFPPFTAVVLKRSDFLAAGGLDESLESYLEDVDFGLRGASKGYTGWYEPGAVAYHAGSATLGRWHSRTVRQIARNQVLLVARHYPATLVVRFGWRIAVAQLLWGLVAFRHGAGLAWLTGKVEGLGRVPRCRRSGDSRIAAVLESSEADIRRFQKESGADWYWRLYFALT
jgi:GT2 family glycosyltransferase